MTLQNLPKRRQYWNVVDGLFPAPAFGKRFGMGLHRFEEILTALSFHTTTQPVPENDKWYKVRPLVQMLNEKWISTLSPGYKITADESMFSWYGKGNYEAGMPAVMKIRRKPKGVGCEIKNIADSQSNIMIHMEINEGKEAMGKKKWQKEFGAGTATILRLAEPWFHSGRIVLGDSWFASVKTAQQLVNHGLHFSGIVKTATKNFPIREMVSRCPEARGEWSKATATVSGIPMIAIGWRDKKIHCVISSCGTTDEGNPAKKRRVDENGQRYHKLEKRPKILENYFDGAPAIDIYNHFRQSGLALEEAWSTQKWEHRIFGSMFGIVETNAYLAYKYFTNGEKSHSEFTEALALELIGRLATPTLEEDLPTALPGAHTLRPLAKVENEERQRVQRKCVVCSKIRKVQQKASYYCVLCGPATVLCIPQTNRDCFAYHVEHGLP